MPIQEARVEGEDLVVPYTKDQVKDAPGVDPDGHVDPAEEDRLYEHYRLAGGRTYTDANTGTETRTDYDTTARGTVGHDTSGRTTDDAMTRSEEQLHVGKEREATGRARLRKYVTTENVTKTVPVEREEVRVEREPITDANRGARSANGARLFCAL
jgi:stress response protein YsnF